jgi:hypothetical protein
MIHERKLFHRGDIRIERQRIKFQKNGRYRPKLFLADCL